MARIEYGTIITDIIGSIGGITFQHNRSGKVARLRPKSYKKSTDAQTIQQAKHSAILSSWQNLSRSNQILWNDYADLYTKDNKFGQEKKLSGVNWFESTNLSRQIIDLPLLLSPPIHTLPCAVPSFSVEITQSEMNVNFDSPFDTTDNALIIRATNMMTNTTTNFQNGYRYITYEGIGNINFIDIVADWQSVFSCIYPPSENVANYAIAVMVQVVNKSSGIQSVGVTNISRYFFDDRGLGYWSIGTTFKIT